MAASCRARPRVALGLGVCLLLASCGGGGSGGSEGGTADAPRATGGRGGSTGGAAGGGAGGQAGTGGQPATGGGNGSPGGAGGAAGTGASGGGGSGAGLDAAGAGPDVPAADAPAGTDAASSCGVCTSWGQPQQVGRVQTAGLTALSGMAASWRNPGVLYVHNDRDQAVVFAVTEAGALLGRYTLGGATVRDIEDMAVGRCPGGTCLLVADIGNNISPRTEFAIYRASEPAVDAAGPTGAAAPAMTIAAERFAFSYADGGHNAESLIIDHATGAVYIVTKETGSAHSAAYRLESFEAGQMNRAVKVADLAVPAAGDSPVTSGTGHPCAPGVLLRTNGRLYELRAAAGAPFADAFRATPAMLPVGTEVQGEAVTFRADGRAYYTTSEGAAPPIHKVSCQ
jgi:hypothetical protein